ncbi:hypothetical protein QFC20_002514 [Naganishia adeliensis]|uniref:Uncharacterized protein n=1 Tax=Naganishia adeliensis TaxID=92952 RepID=A0ACC2WKC5_9TREE|nr:hypothetical protein QFC20_002514 [Naganishia adeliensis]
MAAAPTKKAIVRVLALPGYTQNAAILSRKMGSVRKTSKQVEWVFLDPLHILDKVDFGNGTATLADFDSESTMDQEQRTPETTPRAWFTASHDHSGPNNVKTTYNMMDETIAYLHDFLIKQDEPFDGVFGFSQGACMSALLAALMEKPPFHPQFPPHPKLKPFKFAICCGGFEAADPALANFYPITTPTLHIIGKNDTIVTEERSRTLIRHCDDYRIEIHDGSHFVPSKANWRHFLAAYITSFTDGGEQGDVPPPSSFGPQSTNTSAAGTRQGTPEPNTTAAKEGDSKSQSAL